MNTTLGRFFVLLTSTLVAGSVGSQVMTRISEAVGGGAGNGESRVLASRWSITSDSRYVAFESDASDLVEGDTNGVTDVFLRDVELGITTRVSVGFDGSEADGPSQNPSISSDGRYVAFQSEATNLVEDDGNGFGDVFVRDVHGGTTIRASVNAEGGDANGGSRGPSINGDGRVLSFHSDATDLVSGDGNGVADIFVRYLDRGETIRVSVDTEGGDPDANSWGSTVSADGRFVAFTSGAGDLVSGYVSGFRNVFVRDLEAGRTMWASVDLAGTVPDEGSIAPSLSADGRFVSFWSNATNLVEGDTNGQADIFVRDLEAGVTSRVSVSSRGDQAEGAGSYQASISADGRYVVFMSDAENLVTDDSNGWGDVFGHDRATGTTTLLSVTATGDQADDFSRAPAVSADGRYVVFESAASNLVSGDTNGLLDVLMGSGPAAVANNVRIIPGAATIHGAGGSHWITDIRLFNPDLSNSMTVWLAALLRDEDNSSAAEVPVTIDARQGVALDDVLSATFGLSEAAAAIRMRSEMAFFATSRTYDVAGEEGTFGSFMPSFGPEDSLDRGIILHVSNDPANTGFRSNIGFVNPGLTSVTVVISVFDADTATLVGGRSLDLQPRTFSQVNNVFQFVGSKNEEVENATVEFSATAPVLAYASVIDNASNDPVVAIPCADTGTLQP